MKVLLRTLLAFWVVLSAHAAANTQWRLILSADTAQPGQTIMAGLEMKIPAKWHTYWQNPGDSGIASSIKWTLPTGIKAGEIQWPVPKKFTESQGEISLVTYIYQDAIVLLIPLEIAKDAPTGKVELHGKVSWQECEELCVQGHTDVTATLNIGPETKPSADAALIDQWRQRLPKTEPKPNATAHWESSTATGDERAVVIEWQTTDTNADFFPYKQAGFDVTGPTQLTSEAGKVRLRKTVTKSEGDWPTSLSGLLVPSADAGKGTEVTLPIEAPTTAAAATAQPFTWGRLLTTLASALLAGFILNIMPCVLPIVALKVLGFVNQTKEEAARSRKLSLVYALGILLSFIALAVVTITVHKAGGIADWTALFRNPIVRVVVTTVILLVALNLFGVFEITLSGRTMGAATELASKEGYPGAFFNGVLATVLATPCTAPYLSAAFLFAVSQPAAITILVFIFIGIGLALPYVLLCWFPALRRFMPRPGPWMERFKVAVGFPLLATAVWLFWGSAKDDELLWLGFFLVTVAFVAWIWGTFVQRGSRRRGLAMAIAAILLVVSYVVILEGKLQWRIPVAAKKHGIEWKVWSPEAVEQARRDGHPVLVDFTAKLCANCAWNKTIAIEIPETRAKLKQMNAVAFKGDYSDEDPAIGHVLQNFGRAGVPLVLVYPKDLSKKPLVLPERLNKDIVLQALDQVAGSAPTQSASR